MPLPVRRTDFDNTRGDTRSVHCNFDNIADCGDLRAELCFYCFAFSIANTFKPYEAALKFCLYSNCTHVLAKLPPTPTGISTRPPLVAQAELSRLGDARSFSLNLARFYSVGVNHGRTG